MASGHPGTVFPSLSSATRSPLSSATTASARASPVTSATRGEPSPPKASGPYRRAIEAGHPRLDAVPIVAMHASFLVHREDLGIPVPVQIPRRERTPERSRDLNGPPRQLRSIEAEA